MSAINHDDYLEVVVTDDSRREYFYWVKTEDVDEAVYRALERHTELGLPPCVDDEDEGVFPMAYPVIEAIKMLRPSLISEPIYCTHYKA